MWEVTVVEKAEQKLSALSRADTGGGTWTQRSYTLSCITSDSAFTMTAQAQAGTADAYAGTVRARQVE